MVHSYYDANQPPFSKCLSCFVFAAFRHCDALYVARHMSISIMSCLFTGTAS